MKLPFQVTSGILIGPLIISVKQHGTVEAIIYTSAQLNKFNYRENIIILCSYGCL